MKVGDLVKDKSEYTNQLGDIVEDMNQQLGVIIEVDEYEGMFKVVWNGLGEEWLTEMYLEVISK